MAVEELECLIVDRCSSWCVWESIKWVWGSCKCDAHVNTLWRLGRLTNLYYKHAVCDCVLVLPYAGIHLYMPSRLDQGIWWNSTAYRTMTCSGIHRKAGDEISHHSKLKSPLLLSKKEQSSVSKWFKIFTLEHTNRKAVCRITNLASPLRSPAECQLFIHVLTRM